MSVNPRDWIRHPVNDVADWGDKDTSEHLEQALRDLYGDDNAVEFSAKDVTPRARAKLKGILDHYRKKAHPFTACVSDQVKNGLTKDHAERRCAVIKDLALGTTKWRGKDKKFEEADGYDDTVEFTDAELDEWLAENRDVHDLFDSEGADDSDFEEARARAIRDLG